MDTRLHVRGRVTTDPNQIEGDPDGRVTFLLENHQRARVPAGQDRPFILEEWCEVVCDGALAQNVVRYVTEGDHVSIWGELRVVRTSQDVDSVLLTLIADTVGHDLCYEPSRTQLLSAAA